MYRFALHMSGSPAVADDVTQDVFLAVMRSADRYQPSRSPVVIWLCGIARNSVRQHLERERPFEPLASLAGRSEREPGVEVDLPGDLARAEGLDRLRRLVLALPVRYREAVVLCDLQELSYAEAAAAIGCRVGTVRSRLHRGRELLAAKLGVTRGPNQAAAIDGERCPA